MPLMGRDPAELLAAKERQQACVSEAVRTGVLSGIEGGAVSGACVFALNHYVEFFRTKFPVSAKTSFVVREGCLGPPRQPPQTRFAHIH